MKNTITPKKMRADEVLRALSRAYSSDGVLFLSEVKTGPTWFSDGLQRIDALTIKKSWTQPCITAYEVKVSRADFLADEKWPGYLDYCHRLYFACPSGLISPDEISNEVGLVWVNESGGVKVRKRALFRSIDLPHSLFYHLVISHLQPSRHPFFSNTREMLLAYLEDKNARRALGRLVRVEVLNKIREMETATQELQSQADKFKELDAAIQSMKEKIRGAGYRGYFLEKLVDELLKDATVGQALNKLQEIRPQLELLVKALPVKEASR